MGATAGIGEHPLTLLDHALGLGYLAVLIVVWRALLDSRFAPDEPAAVLTYLVLAQVLGPQLRAETKLTWAIWDGSVATRLLRPMSAFGDHLSEMVGSWLLGLVTFALPGVALALALGVSLAPADGSSAAVAAVSLVLSVAVGAALDFAFSLLVISAPELIWGLIYARNAVLPLLSGAVIPFSLLPFGLEAVLNWLPFAATVSTPLRIYTGDGPVAGPLALQLAWAVALWLGVRVWWTRSAPRMVSFGG